MRLVIDDIWVQKANDYLPCEMSYSQALALKNSTVPFIGSLYGVLHNDAHGLKVLGDVVNQMPYKAAPKSVVLYNKPRNTFRSDQQSLIAPKGVVQLHIGSALAIVVGDVAARLTLDNALQVVAGYTVVADASIPHDMFYRPSLRFKAFDASCAIGPWVRGAKQVPDPDALTISTYVNDELLQEYSTAIFTRGIAQLLVDVTEFMTLNRGDVLMLGVGHPGVLVKVGDVVKIEIEHVGILTNTVESA